jgi:hypothetical protein
MNERGLGMTSSRSTFGSQWGPGMASSEPFWVAKIGLNGSSYSRRRPQKCRSNTLRSGSALFIDPTLSAVALTNISLRVYTIDNYDSLF